MKKKIEARFTAVRASKTFRNLRTFAGLEEKKVLDIGCSYGEFLVHFGKESVGISIEPQEVAYGRENGIEIKLGNVEDQSFESPGRFDTVFANNLLEHLYSPHAFLIKTKEFLVPDGVLVLGVPCVPKIVSLLRFRKFRGSLAAGHINFFTKETLRHTVERAGWKIECVRGFRLGPSLLDTMLDWVYPHFYVIAKPDSDFTYGEKRQRELAGYRTLP